MVIHPPMLYMGYVGFSVAFAFAIAALLERPARRRVGALVAAVDHGRVVLPHHRHRARQLVGVLRARLGRLVVLGPGRERLLHAVARRHRAASTRSRSPRSAARSGAGRCCSRSSRSRCRCVGTFLVRSGRAHLGARVRDRPDARRLHPRLPRARRSAARSRSSPGARRGSGWAASFAPVSRESLLLANNVLLVVAMAAVLLGTLYPLFLDALNLGKISVGPPYFDTVFYPLMAPAGVPAWRSGPSRAGSAPRCRTCWARLRWALGVAIVAALAHALRARALRRR